MNPTYISLIILFILLNYSDVLPVTRLVASEESDRYYTYQPL